jgi:hypothetical protein
MRILCKILATAALAGLYCPIASAASDPAQASLPVIVPDKDLDKMRGGFVWSGLEINFGADIRTYVNGELVLRTALVWTGDGAQTEQAASESLTRVDMAALESGILSTGSIRMRVGDTPVYLLNNGRTAISHGTENGVQNMLINTADGLNAVQEVDANLSLSGYAEFSAGLAYDRMVNTLNDLGGQGGVRALGN